MNLNHYYNQTYSNGCYSICPVNSICHRRHFDVSELSMGRKLANEGYIVLDIGYSTGEKYSQHFYNIEKNILFPYVADFNNQITYNKVETINTIASKLIVNFDFLKKLGFIIKDLDVFNSNDEKTIYARLTFENQEKDRKIVFTITPKDAINIRISLSNSEMSENINLRDYIEFINGNQARYYAPFTLDSENLIESLDVLSSYIERIFKSDFIRVIAGKEWIDMPSYDSRDQSNYH